MPEPMNCRRCGKVFTYLGGAMICPMCKEKDEEDFARVKEYLYQNPGASMNQVSQDLEVPVEKITRFLKEGRLEIVDGSNLILECEKCGRAINTGRFCNECIKGLEGELKSTARDINIDISKKKSEEIGLRYMTKKDTDINKK